MKKILRRYRKWKIWRQYTWMNKFQQILVLLKLKPCTWFEVFVISPYDELYQTTQK